LSSLEFSGGDEALFAVIAEALRSAILSWTLRAICMSWMGYSLMAQEIGREEILNASDLIEFDNFGLNELLEPIADLLRIDVSVAGKDFLLELLGGIAAAAHIVEEGKEPDK
jgi:hypothetical protein